jgi:hypothetical protein
MPHDADYFTDRSHLLITGVTGARTDYGGKTTVANYLFDTAGKAAFDLRLFVNVKLDDGPEKTADVVCQSIDEVATAMGDGHRHICLSPTDYDWEAVSRRVRDFVRELPDDMEKFVVLDEAPEMDEDALMWFCRVAGNGNNVKTLLLSQNPGDMPSSLRTNVILVWVGPATGNNKHIFEANNRRAHYEHIRENHDPYEWTVMTGPDAADRDYYDPVPEEYA